MTEMILSTIFQLILFTGIHLVFYLVRNRTFRGFIAKRLINSFGYHSGNITQALIFGVLHFLMFLRLDGDWLFAAFIFLMIGTAAWVSVFLNEKMADGSIIPGWIAHATGNLLAYAFIGFVL